MPLLSSYGVTLSDDALSTENNNTWLSEEINDLTREFQSKTFFSDFSNRTGWPVRRKLSGPGARADQSCWSIFHPFSQDVWLRPRLLGCAARGFPSADATSVPSAILEERSGAKVCSSHWSNNSLRRGAPECGERKINTGEPSSQFWRNPCSSSPPPKCNFSGRTHRHRYINTRR